MNEGTRLTHDGSHSGNFWNERTVLEKILLVFVLLAISVGIILSVVIATHRKGSKTSEIGLDKNVCSSTECILSAARLISSMDMTVDPCKDFFHFSCGGWVKKTFLLGKRVSRLTKLTSNIMLRMKELLEMPINDNSPQHWLKTKNFYNSCMDLSKRQGKAISLIKDLDEFGLWPPFQRDWNSTNFNWVDVLKEMFQRGYDYNILLSIYVDLDLRNSSNPILAVDTPSLGMGSRTPYLLNSSENFAIDAYRSFILQSVRLLYPELEKEDAEKQIEEAVEMEILLAKASRPPSEKRDFEKSYNKMSFAELEEFIPEVKTLIQSLLPGNVSIEDDEKILVPVPDILTAVGGIVQDESKRRILANYVMYRIVLEATHDLSHSFVQLFYDFHNALSGILYSYPDPWQQCVDLTGQYFYHSIASVYSKEYFEEETKSNIVSLLTDIEDSMMEQINNAKWMDQETRTKASNKANKIYAIIGYPDEILNDTILDDYYEKIPITDIHYKNVRKVQSFFSMMSMSGLHEIYDSHNWENVGNLLLANAFYSPTKNSITIPVGVIQGETYNSKQPNYLNYGSLGTVIGHELTHAFDDLGSKFDENGDWKFWWRNDTYQKFLNKSQCFVDQYNQYEESSVKKKVNGTRTLGENIADQGGLDAAYMAYEKWVAQHGSEKSLPGLPYSPKQLFWVAFAEFWCDKRTKEDIFSTLLNSVHAPHDVRVKGSVSNMDRFAKDFKCQKNSAMNPPMKCSVWT